MNLFRISNFEFRILSVILVTGYSLLITASIAIAAAPAITSVYPANGATNVEARPLITVYFDKDINPATVNNDTFKLKNKFLYTTYISGEVSYSVSERKAVFKLNGNLINNTKYAAVITTGVKDSSGNQMASEYAWDFTIEESRDTVGAATGRVSPSPSPSPSIELSTAEQPPLEKKTDEASPVVSKTIGRVFSGIVPCGTKKQCDDKSNCRIINPCTICHLFVGVKNIIDFLTFDIAMPLGVIVLIYGGVMILTSGGSEDKLKKGKQALWFTLWGLVIVFASFLIIGTIMGNLVKPGFLPWESFPGC